ncbi:MAG: hypothetical protein ACRYG8_23365 [Janthinobacterium lividum]
MLREQLAASDRSAAELRKLIAEAAKLDAERLKLSAEERKLGAEARKFDRDVIMQGVLAATGIIGWIATAAGLLSKWKGGP